MGTPWFIAIGHKCTYEGRVPDESRVAKIRDWQPAQDITDVRSFLGVAGVLLKKDVQFEWGTEQQNAMDELKHAIVTSEALKPLDFAGG